MIQRRKTMTEIKAEKIAYEDVARLLQKAVEKNGIFI